MHQCHTKRVQSKRNAIVNKSPCLPTEHNPVRTLTQAVEWTTAVAQRRPKVAELRNKLLAIGGRNFVFCPFYGLELAEVHLEMLACFVLDRGVFLGPPALIVPGLDSICYVNTALRWKVYGWPIGAGFALTSSDFLWWPNSINFSPTGAVIESQTNTTANYAFRLTESECAAFYVAEVVKGDTFRLARQHAIENPNWRQ